MDTHVTQQLERGRFTATVTIEAEVLFVEALAVAIRRDIEVTNTRAVVVECLEPGGARILALVEVFPKFVKEPVAEADEPKTEEVSVSSRLSAAAKPV